MKHLEIDKILDLVEQRLGQQEQRAAVRHIGACAQCSEKAAWAEKSLQAMKAAVVEAPEYVVRKAVALFPGKKRGLLDWVIARLEFDSWAAPAAAGVRSAGADPRQFIYTTGGYRIILMAEPSGRTVRVTGQLIPGRPGVEPRGCLVEFVDRKKVLTRATTGQDGGFQLEGPRSKQLQLRVHGDPESVVISCRF